MTPIAWMAATVAVVAALVDWWSVAADRRRIEYVAKPLVLVALIVVAVTLVPAQEVVRWWFVVGLVGGLIGDVWLMFDRFIPGAAAFLLGHIAYIVGLLTVPLEAGWLAVGVVLFVITLATVGRRIVAGAWQRSTVLGLVVVGYLFALGAVLILGVGTAVTPAVLGVLVFALSDALLAWGRFVGTTPGGRTLVHVTYHGAQALLVGALLVL